MSSSRGDQAMLMIQTIPAGGLARQNVGGRHQQQLAGSALQQALAQQLQQQMLLVGVLVADS
jgi:hypothetical protein